MIAQGRVGELRLSYSDLQHDRIRYYKLTKTVYFYKEYRYNRLSDALRYAKSDTKGSQEGGEPATRP